MTLPVFFTGISWMIVFFFPLNCYSKKRGRIADFFFLFLQKRDMAHFNIPIIYVSVHKRAIWKALWFHNDDKPFLMPLALSTEYLGLHFHTWNGNSLTNCPQTFLTLTHPSDFVPFYESYAVPPFMPTYCTSPSRHNSNSAFSLKQSLPILTHSTISFFWTMIYSSQDPV